MKLTRKRLIDIIKEEMDSSLKPVALSPDASNPKFINPSAPKTKYDSDPTVQDLMFKIEKLMTRVEKLERMLQTKPSPSQEDNYGDTDYAEKPLP
tara:strand:- start:545 stop:829 length:285 start_codon:yes stop_codon:yes gene_type:complete